MVMAMATATILLFSVLSLLHAVSPTPQDFTADLIRRDSPEMPRLRLRSAGSPFSDVFESYGAYMMKIQIGTPPLEITGVADTGSDIIWTQCLPCISCFGQDDPKFNPISSSTYADAPCGSSQCQSVRSVHCDTYRNSCPYQAFYADHETFSLGTVGTDTVTLNSGSGEPFVLRETAIGCGHNNSLSNSEASGVVGLGWGPASLVSQMGDAINGLFSYCLGPKTSKINFGANAVVSGEGTVSTRLFRKRTDLRKYYLNLDAVSVDGNRLETTGTPFHATDGNIFIDSGTTYTMLPMDYYLRVKEALVSSVKAERLTEGYEGYVCYKSDSLEDFPVITMHFKDADLVLQRSNTYLKTAPRVICLSILPADEFEPSILGFRTHSNFLVGYDTQSEIISFKPTNCSALYS